MFCPVLMWTEIKTQYNVWRLKLCIAWSVDYLRSRGVREVAAYCRRNRLHQVKHYLCCTREMKSTVCTAQTAFNRKKTLNHHQTGLTFKKQTN